MNGILTVRLSDGYKAVVDAELDRLFKMTGAKEAGVWLSTEKYTFELFSGEDIKTNMVIGPVLEAAQAKGYGGKRKGNGELRQEIVLLLQGTITVEGEEGNCWYIQKNQASPQWKSLGTFPIVEEGPADAVPDPLPGVEGGEF